MRFVSPNPFALYLAALERAVSPRRDEKTGENTEKKEIEGRQHPII